MSAENSSGREFFNNSLKKEDARRGLLAGFKTPSKIQPKEYSMGGGTEDNSRNFWQDDNGNRNVAYLNWNDGKWRLNFNWLNNNFNGNYRLVRLS